MKVINASENKQPDRVCDLGSVISQGHFIFNSQG